MKYDTIIIGAGPAGMTASITAALKGVKVCLLEHRDRVGKKILSTGNGKCNLTNINTDRSCFHSSSSKDYFRIIESFGPEDIIEFFKSMGMLTINKNGYIYPRCEQASVVLDTLRSELDRLNIPIHTDTGEIKAVSEKDGFKISFSGKTLSCKKLILACGSKCAAKTGSDGSGYVLAKAFGHSVIKVIPALVQLICKDNFYKELQGVRTDALLKLTLDGRIVATEAGELQLTGYGISGIPVFQLSRTVKRLLDKGRNPVIHIDFAKDCSEDELYTCLLDYVLKYKNNELCQAVSGIVNKKLANVIVKECGLKPSAKCSDIDSKTIHRIVSVIKDFSVYPKDTNGFDNAQVCAGGINLDEVNLATMESELCKGLYFAGEILDVDGKCGGYNLTWAFASGKLAGDNQ